MLVRRKELTTCLMVMVGPSQRLLNLCESSKSAVLVPGVHDALSARVFRQQGAQALFLSGFGVSSVLLGQPDAGILTYSEMESVARVVCATANEHGIPVMVDGDTGYGGTAQMRRAIRGLAGIGAAAITIEDQSFPKKCTYITGQGVRVVDRSTSVARLRCALAARQEAHEKDGNHVALVGRTDCRAALGFSEALSRCLTYQELGCDIVYAENLQSRQEYVELRSTIEGTPLMLAQVQLGSNVKQDLYSLQDISNMGYQLALMGISGLQAALKALQDVAQEMQQGDGIVREPPLAAFDDVKAAVNYMDLEDFESNFHCE